MKVGGIIINYDNQVFICFAAEDRYAIVEPIVHHLKNYGINVWYDRYKLLMGDNRIEKNLKEGATNCKYAVIIISTHIFKSTCAMEELDIVRLQHCVGNITLFPILYEIAPNNIPKEFQWIKELIFKEVDRHSGTREVCNHIVCKITQDILENYNYKNIQDIINSSKSLLPATIYSILKSYQVIDNSNFNSRIALLYAAYLIISDLNILPKDFIMNMISKIFTRLFSETSLNLIIDYRELWLLENVICILINYYLASRTESKM